MSKPVVIIFVTEDWAFCVHRMEFARYIRDQGYQVIVATNIDKYGDVIRSEGFELRKVKLKRDGYNPWSELLTLWRVICLYRNVKPDIVHHVAMKPIIYGTLAARLFTRASVLNAVTGLGSVFISTGKKDSIFTRFIKYLYGFSLRFKPSSVVVQNKDDYEFMIDEFKVNEKMLSLIQGSGVDVSKWKVQPETGNDIPVIAYVGRLLRDKGIYELVEAIRLLKQQNVKARFVLIGDEDEKNPTSIKKQQILAWVEEGLLEWWGYRKDMMSAYKEIDIVVLPSYREGLPRSLLEAAACRKAIVTTDTPGCRELIQHGENGLLATVRDSVSLAEALKQLISDKQKRNFLAENARKSVEKYYSTDVVFEAFNQLYSQLNS